MISTSELRIGNLVFDNSNYLDAKYKGFVRVESICDDGINIETSFDSWSARVKDEFLLPIGLTPEILEKSGFKKVIGDGCAVGNYEYYDNGKYETSVLSKFGLTLDGVDSVLIKYVHHLQNLYFSLSGEELNITL